MAEFYADPKFMVWLTGCKPCDELVVRMVLRNGISHLAASRAWNARIDALEREVTTNETDMAKLLTDVRGASEEIERVMAPERKHT